MIRVENVECWMFQLDEKITKSILKELEGWKLDTQYNELWKEADETTETDLNHVREVFSKNNTSYMDAKLYMYTRVYLDLDDREDYGEDVEFESEGFFDELLEKECYYDTEKDFYQFLSNRDNRFLSYSASFIDKEVKKQKIEKGILDDWDGVVSYALSGKTIEEKYKYLKKLDQVTLSLNSVIVRAPRLQCQEEHTVKEMAGRVLMTNKLGQVVIELVPIKHCLDEDAFFMLDVDYKELVNRGKILCNVITYKEYEKHGIAKRTYDQLEPKSKLKLMGYSVSKQDGLSQEARVNILRGAIEYGIMSKDEIVSFLRWCHKYHATQHPEAAQKYLDDIKYLQYADIEKKPTIDIEEFIIK